MASTGDPANDDERQTSADRILALTFAAEAGKQMLESSTSVSEVLDRLKEFLPSVGLENCSLDATMSYLILSYWDPDREMPITVMRDISVESPRLEVLAGTDALLGQVEHGDIGLDDALTHLRSLVREGGRSARATRLALLLSVVGWVLFLDGTNLLTIAVAVVATGLTFPVEHLVERFRLPALAGVFAIAVIVAAIPNLLSAAGASILVGPAVVGALYYHLPGRAFVSSVIDGLANQPLSSVARGVEAVVTSGFIALGMLVGNRVGAGLGLEYTPDANATPIGLSVVGAVMGALGVGLAWGMPRRSIAPTVAIAGASWLVVGLAGDSGRGSGWLVTAIGASIVGALGVIVADRLNSPASMFTGIAILPLVPGFTLYTSMLDFAQGNTSDGVTKLLDAGTVSLAIAIGVALGISIGRNAMLVSQRLPQLTSRQGS